MIDVASGGELFVALASGVSPERLILHGSSKSVGELTLALSLGLGRIVVDSLDEIERLERLACSFTTGAKKKSSFVSILVFVCVPTLRSPPVRRIPSLGCRCLLGLPVKAICGWRAKGARSKSSGCIRMWAARCSISPLSVKLSKCWHHFWTRRSCPSCVLVADSGWHTPRETEEFRP